MRETTKIEIKRGNYNIKVPDLLPPKIGVGALSATEINISVLFIGSYIWDMMLMELGLGCMAVCFLKSEYLSVNFNKKKKSQHFC